MQKLLLDASAHNLAVRNNQYLVGIADRIQPVSYDNQRFSRHQFADGLLDQCLVLRVGIGGCLVQNDDGCLFEHGPRNGDALPLSTGKPVPGITGHGIIALF